MENFGKYMETWGTCGKIMIAVDDYVNLMES
jgi:uncharacterized short protein YbdD (DUF466 family)